MTSTRGEGRESVGVTMSFVEIELGTDLYHEALRLREQVLRAPLNLTLTDEDLASDGDCFHLGVRDGSRLLAVLLLQRMQKNEVKMRQVAVSPDAQQHGIGSFLVTSAERYAKDRGYCGVFADARESAIPFYEKLGYFTSGAAFLEHTIAHRRIVKVL